MRYRVQALGRGSAHLVEAEERAPLEAGLGNVLRGLLDEAGVVLMRGFRTDLASFSELVKASSSRITLDPTRPFHSESAQLVDAGTNPVTLHCENANSPFRPDFIWFFCQQTAERDGATTYCDGIGVWTALGEATQELFRQRPIEYHRSYPEPVWKAYVAHLLGINNSADVGQDEIERALAGAEGLTYRLRDDGWIDTVYSCFAAPLSRSGVEAFGNSIRGPYPGQTVTLDGGEPIPPAVLEEIDRVYESLTEEIPWQDGDVAWIDNSRFLHGRRPFEGRRRRIFAALSFA